MTRQPCIHHWIIEPDGRRGQCKFCGLVRIYPTLSNLSVGQYKEMRRVANEEVKAASTAPGIAESGLVPGRSNRRRGR